MYRLTHVYVGLVAGIVFGGTGFRAVICGLCGALGGYIPDIDLSLSHRKTLHNLTAPASLIILLYILVKALDLDPSISVILKYATISTALGWVLHIVTDSLTSKGVYPLYPFSKFRLRLLRLRSNSLSANLALIILTSLIFLWWFERKGFIYEFNKLMEIFVKSTSPS